MLNGDGYMSDSAGFVDPMRRVEVKVETLVVRGIFWEIKVPGEYAFEECWSRKDLTSADPSIETLDRVFLV
jgi:hypothetical protein